MILGVIISVVLVVVCLIHCLVKTQVEGGLQIWKRILTRVSLRKEVVIIYTQDYDATRKI